MARGHHCRAEHGDALVRSNDGAPLRSALESSKRRLCQRKGCQQHDVIAQLRERIRRIENRSQTLETEPSDHPGSGSIPETDRLAAGPLSGLPAEDDDTFPRNASPPVSSSSPASFANHGSAFIETSIPHQRAAPLWSLGDDALDDLVGVQGLDIDGVHEIKPRLATARDPSTANWAASWSAARSFMLALLMRRLQTSKHQAATPPAFLWCWPRVFAQEFGTLYGPGLTAHGVSLADLIIIEPTRSQDVLWAIEEGLKSNAMTCVIGLVDDVGLTPSRRLALAAQKHATPCLVLTHPRSPPMAATATRWQAAPRSSAAHPIDPALPGDLRLDLSLERRRANPLAGGAINRTVEWCHETLRFRLATDVCNRPVAASFTPQHEWALSFQGSR